VFPKDKFSNAITDADGYAVTIDGSETVDLLGPDFSHTHSIPAEFKGDVELAFTLNGEHIKDSPVVIKVAPAAIGKKEIAAIVAGALALASLLFYYVYRRREAKAARDVAGVALAGMAKVKKMVEEQERQRDTFQQKELSLQKQNSSLQASLRKKKHSDDELEVMKNAMTNVSSKRQEELKGVLIPSSEVKVDRLLGKGGFGVVNLASYNGQWVAMKQLLTIKDDSVKRFR